MSTATAVRTVPRPVSQRSRADAAPRSRRLLAAIIDGFAVNGMTQLALQGGLAVSPTNGGLAAGLVVAVAAWALYYLFTMLRPERPGQTLGKQLAGVRVVRTDGTPLTAGHVFMRQIVVVGGLATLTFGLFSLVEAVLALFAREGRTLHDRAVGTVVVKA
jgi:uncharacterized RDD family membrane protein YckC